MVMRGGFILLWLAGLAWGAENGAVERRPDGLWYLPNQSVPYTGKAERKHFDGTRISLIHYYEGKQHGLTQFWYPNGKPRSAFQYIEGQLDGNATYFYRNGNRQNLTTYRLGGKHGPVIDWWPDGEKSFEEHYNNGVPEGLWKSWWPDGKIASEKIYKNHRLVSHREWNRNGMPKVVVGWNLDGTFKSAASVAQRQQILGRRILWNRASGPNRIDLIYRDKSLKTIRTVFGDPDMTDDGLWTYKGLRIQDPNDGRMFDTATFRFKKSVVTEIWIE